FSPRTGGILSRETVAVPDGESVTSFGRSESRKSLFVYGFSDGSVLPLKVDYEQSFPEGVRVVTPKLSFPFGEQAIRIGDREAGDYSALTVVEGRGGYVVAAGTREGEIAMALFATRRNMLTGDVQISRDDYVLPSLARPVRRLL